VLSRQVPLEPCPSPFWFYFVFQIVGLSSTFFFLSLKFIFEEGGLFTLEDSLSFYFGVISWFL
jgi:hypothetical protein